MPLNWMLEKDNDKKHTYKLVKVWFHSQKIKTENLRDIVKEANALNLKERFAVIKKSWENIQTTTVNNWSTPCTADVKR